MLFKQNLQKYLSVQIRIWLYCLFAVALTSYTGCATISHFDQRSFEQTTSLKVDALDLMDDAIEPYNSHSAEVKKTWADIRKAYEYERFRNNNELTVQMWEQLIDTNGHLWGGFIVRWRQNGNLGAAFIRNSKKQVAEAFENIARLESNKRRR